VSVGSLTEVVKQRVPDQWPGD